MATYTRLLLHDAARRKVLAGATALAEAVRPTLGPRSRSVLLGRTWGTPVVCDDGVTIARTVKLKDPEEDLGAQLLKDAAVRTGDTVGDGTTTATLLAHHLYAEVLRSVTVGASAVELRRGLQRGLRAADEALLALSRPVEGRVELAHIATVSAHDEPEVGDLVADAIDQVGPQGVIEVEEAKGIETSLRVVEGMQFDTGYLSPYSVTDPERMEAVLVDPVILLHEKRIASVGELLPLLEDLVGKSHPLLVIAETVEGEALSTLVVNKLRGTFLAVAAKAPGFGDLRRPDRGRHHRRDQGGPDRPGERRLRGRDAAAVGGDPDRDRGADAGRGRSRLRAGPRLIPSRQVPRPGVSARRGGAPPRRRSGRAQGPRARHRHARRGTRRSRVAGRAVPRARGTPPRRHGCSP